MLFVTGAHKQILVFISHSAENNVEARQYEDLLTKAGFTTFQYGHGLHPGEKIKDNLAIQIRRCHFFLFIVSDYSEKSEWVQRELGLALDLQRQHGCYRPVIIPLYAKEATWRRTHALPTHFPTRHFETGEDRAPFDLNSVRGLDKYANPSADSDEFLLSQMRPMLWTSRHDFDDEAKFDETDVFSLYKELFPEHEQDSPEDIIRWVLHSDLGKTRSVRLPEGGEIEYKLDSRYFIMTLADRAIGLGFFTYDFSSSLVYGNYIAVHECWRGADLASTFVDKIAEVLGDLFPEYRGMVFEVEKFDRGNLERIVTYLETSPDKKFQTEEDRAEFRKALRIAWYQKMECNFFLDTLQKQPMTCKSPCLAPEVDDWKSQEEDYWIMWKNRPGTVLDIAKVKELWRESVQCIYVEILAKSLVEAYPEVAQEYWNYTSQMVNDMLLEGKQIGFGRYFYRNDPLMKRLVKLKMNISI